MTTNRLGLLLFANFTFVFFSCKKEKNITENSCDRAKQLSAEFLVQENYITSAAWQLYSTDTVCVPTLRFDATDSTASAYNWHIGAGNYSAPSVSLEFPDIFLTEHATVSVELEVKGTDNLNCFPRMDTVKRSIKTVYFTDQSLVKGKFQGYLEENPKTVFTIEVDPARSCSDIPNGTITTTDLYISNLVEGCDFFVGTCSGGKYKVGYRQITFSSEACHSPSGIIKIDHDNRSLIIDYLANDNGYQLPAVSHKFIGKKIN